MSPGRSSERATSEIAIWLPRVMHTFDAAAARPRVARNIAATASRRRT